MTTKKKNYGQLPMSGIEAGVEKSYPGGVKGLPPLEMIKTETAKLGLPDSDAECIYDTWLANGFKTARGHAIRDWRATVRNWFRWHFFPSQKIVHLKPSHDPDEKAKAAIRRMRDGQNPTR